MKNTLNTLLVIVILFLILGCSKSKTETTQTKSGNLKYVETLVYGAVGGHGSHGWYVDDRNFEVNGRRWSPSDFKTKDIGDCEPSPNESVEVLKCYSSEGRKELAFILRLKDGKPEWVTASDRDYDNGDNYGEWAGDGHWLIFRDNLFNVETSEKKEIKGLPADPFKYFRTVSPDLETVVFQGDCFFGSKAFGEMDERRKKTCENSNEHLKNKIETLWVIDAKTGDTKLLELSREKYDWLIWNKEKFASQREWLKYFEQQLIWEKDRDGKFQLVSPK